MTNEAQQRTMEELRQELSLLRDMANLALERFGMSESAPLPERPQLRRVDLRPPATRQP